VESSELAGLVWFRDGLVCCRGHPELGAVRRTRCRFSRRTDPAGQQRPPPAAPRPVAVATQDRCLGALSPYSDHGAPGNLAQQVRRAGKQGLLVAVPFLFL
jgi:hypothetical protein